MRSLAHLAAPLLAISVALLGYQLTGESNRAAAQAPPQKPATPAPARITSEIENEDTHVWKVHLPAKQSSSLHRHNHPRVVVALSGGPLKLVVKGAAPRVLPWQGGKAYWIPADASGEYHTYLNDSDRPIEFIYIEFERSR
jgi:quercetin dioxygenase-like cupin family protein